MHDKITFIKKCPFPVMAITEKLFCRRISFMNKSNCGEALIKMLHDKGIKCLQRTFLRGGLEAIEISKNAFFMVLILDSKSEKGAHV